MKKILTAAVALAVCYRLRPIKAYAWSGTTHEDIVKKSLALLEKEKKQKQVTFIKTITARYSRAAHSLTRKTIWTRVMASIITPALIQRARSFLKLTAITATALVTLQ